MGPRQGASGCPEVDNMCWPAPALSDEVSVLLLELSCLRICDAA